MPVAVVTGASRGLGAALAHELTERGWQVVVDARGAEALRAAAAGAAAAVPGDVTDPAHRDRLVAAAEALGGADLLVNNASRLGASPLTALAETPAEVLEAVLGTNVVAPLALVGALLPQLRRNGGRVVGVSSDAAVEAYPTWGPYGASKAALDHAMRVLAAEEPRLRVYAVDPGDMRTQMHQDAFPGEDISDRPEPATVVPALMTLVTGDLPSGRYRAADLLEPTVGAPR
jgi:NAD(P)-dependent dehydrogenase (short-subunit alcohol dehydrogenase family)